MKYLSLVISILLIVACKHDSKNSNEKFEAIEKVDTVFVHDTTLVRDSVATLTSVFNQLSYKYNYKISFTEYYENSEAYKHFWTVEIFDKKMNLVDTIILDSYLYYFPQDMQFVTTSYITDFNTDMKIMDEYYGDVVIADVNFDNLEDLAIAYDTGASNGPFYTFYIQNNGHFERDGFLTDSVYKFPGKIDRRHKQITTYWHATASCSSENLFHYNSKTKSWKRGERILHCFD
ncbi:hypothetical protein K6119_14660 [Paracrocinitomix mangrovi]|uniref:XAC2610-related protein n=1 Tax=Paracrocinitomix mangrovi TaxID=2862509 RepID=UPI001C8EE768|nr:hypothetical protein [Paracrocinitomix mangrovi]UKN00974.1 hypothetical protein K6119_14660 [Paracrocinitomix mangrovi]